MASVVGRMANGADLYTILKGNQRATYVWHSLKLLMPGLLLVVHGIKLNFSDQQPSCLSTPCHDP